MHVIWSVFPFISIAAGVVLTAYALRLHDAFRRAPVEGPRRALDLVRSFRAVLVGLALIGVGAGILADIGWLVMLSLIIGGQELLETSIMAAALNDEVRRRAETEGRVAPSHTQHARA
jgi:hypothetical protein